MEHDQTLQEAQLRSELEVMRERHQILYQLLIDLHEEIGQLRARVDMLAIQLRDRS